jgi:hypothetical protein
MPRTREEILEARHRARNYYGELFDATAALLFRHDPIGINFDHNTDEYEPEAETILPRLSDCSSSGDVQRVVHQEFIRWFGDTAGSQERYLEIAQELWVLWQGHVDKPKL